MHYYQVNLFCGSSFVQYVSRFGASAMDKSTDKMAKWLSMIGKNNREIVGKVYYMRSKGHGGSQNDGLEWRIKVGNVDQADIEALRFAYGCDEKTAVRKGRCLRIENL